MFVITVPHILDVLCVVHVMTLSNAGDLQLLLAGRQLPTLLLRLILVLGRQSNDYEVTYATVHLS
jgi:hypothetical protein